MHLPSPVRCTRVPLIVHAPPAAKETARPELAVALTVKSGSPSLLFASAAKLIVCAAFATVNGRSTLVAGR